MENTTHYALQVQKNKELAEHLLLVKKELKHKEQLLQEEISLREKAQEKLQNTTDKLNITNQKIQSLLESEKRLRFFLNSTTTITYTCEAEAPFGATFISANVDKLTGYTPQDYIQDPNFWASNIHPDDKERVFNGLNALFEKGTHQHEYRWKYKNGAYRWMSDELKLIYNEEGKPIEMIGNWIDISKMKETKAKILEANRTVSLAIRSGGVGIWQHDLVNNELKWDDQMFAMYGHNTETPENLYEFWKQQVHPDDLKNCKQQAMEAILGNKDLNTEFRVIWPDKSVHYLMGLAIVERDKAGNPIMMIGTNWDITESKQKEHNLQRSLKEVSDYKHALDESSIVAITDQKGIIKSVNDNFCKISKYSHEELIGQDHKIINSGFHTKEFIKNLWTTIAKGDVWKGEIRNKAKDGTIYWVNTTIVPFLNEQGKPYQYIVIREDITENKLLEEEIRQFNIELERKIKTRTQELTLSKNRFRSLFENAPESILVLDLMTKKFEKVNKNGTKLFQLSAKEFKKKGPQDISPKFQPDGSLSEEKAKMYIEKAIQGEKVSFEWIHCDANNKSIPCEVQLALLPEAKNPRIFASIVDITTRVETREKLKQQNQKLAFQNEEIEKRANELTITNRELKKINSELDRFVYSASHDLRAPLKSLLGLADIIKEDMDQENSIQMEQMDMMKKSIVKLDDFIEDILQYSRNSRTEVIQDEMDFEDTLNGFLKEYEHMEGAKKIKLNVAIQQDMKFVSDKRRINIVLANLISNAFKYKDLSKDNQVVSIEIKCSKANAIICIKDNGIGIDTKDKNKIFEMFYRATRDSEGSGLGLYIVKETLDKLNGTIIVESELGNGTTFLVSLPNQFTVPN